jgi:hypothetical protein
MNACPSLRWPSRLALILVGAALAGCTTTQPPEVSAGAAQWAAKNRPSGAGEIVLEKFAVTGSSGAGAGSYRSSPPRERLPVADLWCVRQPPEAGFGQYTYLLLARDSGSDDDPRRARNLKLLKLVLTNDAACDLPSYRLPRDANHLLVPVNQPASVVELQGRRRTAKAVYADYAFLYADEVMRELGRGGARGPVLFSSNLPLQPGQGLPRQYIVQDLSRCPDDVMDLWLRLFVDASNRPDFWRWDDPTGDKLLAHFVTGLEFAAPIVEQTQSAMKDFIAFFTRGAK